MTGSRFGRAKAMFFVSLMVLSAFTMISVSADSPMSTGSRFTDEPAVNYSMSIGWNNGCMVTYWDLGPVRNDTQQAFEFYYANGTRPGQTELIISHIPEGVFQGEGDDMVYSPFLEINEVIVPDNYIDYTLTNANDVWSSGYTINYNDNVTAVQVMSNNSVLVNDPDPVNKTFANAIYEGSNVTMLVLHGKSASHMWYNYTDSNPNHTKVMDVSISGHKPLFKDVPAPPSSVWSPLVNTTLMTVPAGALADTYRSYSDLLDMNMTDPTNYTLTNVSNHLFLIESISCGLPIHQYEPPVVYDQHEAWVEDQLIKYYDFGETTDDYSNVYIPVTETGERMPLSKQWLMATKVGDGIFTGHAGDPGYSHFAKFINVTIPDTMEDFYFNSPILIDMLGLTTEDTGIIINCPIVPSGSSLDSDPYFNHGPLQMWYNMQEVQGYCIAENLWDEGDIYDAGTDKVKAMTAAEFSTTGQLPVIEHYNSSMGYSPLWNVSYLEPTGDFVEDSVRNVTALDDILANVSAAGFNLTGNTFINRPLAGSVYAGPALFEPAAPATYDTMTGWYDGDQVLYYDLGTVKNKTAPIYVFYYENVTNDNGTMVPDQKMIVNNLADGVFETIPGDSGYTAYWRFEKVIVPMDFEPNTIKSKVDILASGYPVQQIDLVGPGQMISAGSIYPDHPGTPDIHQVWYKDNPVLLTSFPMDLGLGGYDEVNDEIRSNKVYVFPGVENQSVIFDEILSDGVNYTGLWKVVNVSAPQDYGAETIRDAATIEAMLTDSGSGFTSTDLGVFLKPQVGTVITDGIAPQADAGPDMTTKQTVPVTFDGSGSSDNLGIIEYTWTFDDNGTLVTLDGETATYSFDDIGEYEITLNVSDAEDLFAHDTLTVTVLDGLVPVAVAGDDITLELGDIVRLNASASTDNVGIVGYLWDFGDNFTAPDMAVSHSYTSVGEYTVTLNVTDAEGNYGIDTLVVTVVPANNIPSIDPIPAQEVTEGGSFTYTVTATDADGDTLTFSLVDGPVGMTMLNSTGTISFTPTSAMVGQTYTVEVMVDDGKDNVTRSFQLTVKAGLPDTITVKIGPIKDKDADAIKGATVEVTYGTDTRSGKTVSDGTVDIIVPGTWIGKSVSVKVKKDGFKNGLFNGMVNADGTFSPSAGTYPSMKSAEQDLAPDYTFLIIAIIILIVLALILVSMRKPEEGDEIEDEEEDEELDEEDEEVSDEEE